VSLSDVSGFVKNAFLLEPAIPFVPENTVLGFYTFLPWVRTGIAASVTAASGQIRATATVKVPVQGAAAPQDVTQTLVVRGPGDVIGIDARQVIRRYPEPGTTRAEDSFLAHVEFDRPDFPWIFTPAGPQGTQLPPWLVLVVLLAARAEPQPSSGGLPPSVRTTLSELQPLDDSWAWAHAQVVGPKEPDATTPSVDDRLTSQYAPVNLSRLICPRRLAPNQSYVACVVPAYDAGVKAGLGSAQDGTLDRAWERAANGSDADNEIVLPVYATWSFSTGPAGDFESLAKKLVGIPAPWQVGRRTMDVATPGGELPPLAPNDQGRVQTVHGPLVSPQVPSEQSDNADERVAAAAENAVWPPTETEALRTLLNQPDVLSGKEGQLTAEQLPLIGPEIYARHQAAQSRVESGRDADWFGQTNLRPVNRVVAGLGTRVVQRDQELLMQAAWAQVGEIDEVNRQLRAAQLARFIGTSLHERHLKPLALGPLVQLTRPLHGRVVVDQELTLHASVGDSATAAAAATPAFRRRTRPLGPLARYAGGAGRAELDGLLAADGAPRDFQRPYRDLDGVSGVSELAARAVDPALVGSVLGLGQVDANTAAQALVAHGQRLAQTVAVPDALTPQAVQQAQPDPNFQLQQVSGMRVLDVIQQTADVDPATQPIRAVTNLSVVEALKNMGGEVGNRSVDVSNRLRNIVLPSGPIVVPPIEHVPPIERFPPIETRVPHAPPIETHVPHTPPIHIEPLPGHVPAAGIPIGQIEISPNVRLTKVLTDTSAVTPQTAAVALAPIADDLVSPSWPGTPARPQFQLEPTSLLDKLHPAETVTARVVGRIGLLPRWLPPDWFDDRLVQPIMAAPVFTRPMYEALDAYDREWLIPGLATMPEPDVVTVLVSNVDFLEAFLVGLSHEFGRELLWRGYPTDQRGTYFRRFWNDAKDELQQDIHRFAQTELGSHLDPDLKGRLVLLVRGEVIRRYPNAIVLAHQAIPNDPDPTGHPKFVDPSDPLHKAMAPILFHGHLAPDIVLVGFDLTVQEVQTESWWFTVSEHPTAPRFGLAEGQGEQLIAREDVSWDDLPTRFGGGRPSFLNALAQVPPLSDPTVDGGTVTWGLDAATDAHILLRDPVRAAFDAKKLLGPTGALPPS
jgi:hypothetical protein